MARRPASSPSPQSANLTVEQMRRGVDRINKRIADVEAFDPRTVRERFDTRANVIGTGIEETLASVFGHNTVEYNSYLSAQNLDAGPMVFGGGPDSPHEVQQYYTEGKHRSLLLLRQAVRGLEEEIADTNEIPVASPPRIAPKNKVFVVHGHDGGAKQGVARFLEKLRLEAIILDEKPDQGRTIIEKFETYAADVGFAVILLTPDDVGRVKLASDEQERARQNVVFELGYFVGKLGRGRACLLRKGDVEMPSDLAGVIYTELDAADGWMHKLVRELKAAQIQFDANKLWE
ncbi:TIR domain-containing protein [Acidiphilium iwatense]|uniref:Nucleotide-binding protein n=1 Tax=Acidiphilium iwatense TaxID=768198 RepID=A0ABS9DX85_9PROT|nr:nucleotide-binding protein [Acidiphilium iwatense]MCF3947340.1 nucleotide-binding protein [Acidiphilium iwatense]